MGTSSMETTRKFLISLNPIPFVAERFLTRVDPAAHLSRGRARGEKTQEVDVLTSLAATVYSFSAWIFSLWSSLAIDSFAYTSIASMQCLLNIQTVYGLRYSFLYFSSSAEYLHWILEYVKSLRKGQCLYSSALYREPYLRLSKAIFLIWN